MESPRIAIVCSYYPWPPSIGGIETIVRNVSTELAKRGHEVHVVTTPFDVTKMRQVAEYGIEERDGVVVHKLKPGRLRIGYAKLLKGLKDTMREMKPNVVHSHNLHPHLFQLAKWRKKLNYKLVAELHHPICNIDHLSAKLLFPFVFTYFVRSQEKIDAVVAHTRIEEEWLVKGGLNYERIQRVRPATIAARPFKFKLKTTNAWPNGGRVLFIGRIVPKKGVHVLLKAISKLEDASLVVAGPSSKEYLTYLKELVAKLGLKERVKFVGPLSEERKYVLMASCDVFVSPSLHDYGPTTLIEAQAIGKPVISTTVGAIQEIVINEKTGLLVEPGNEKSLANAIMILLQDDRLRNTFSRNAKDFAKQFTAEASVNALQNVYTLAR